jgi:23S rRNA pseudouridine2605 synthase
MNDVIDNCLIDRPGLLAGTVMDDNSNFDNGGERIAKVIARAGLASRREAEGWIATGRVAVNGTVIRSAALNVTARDRIDVDGEPLPARQRTRLFLYHKPRGLVTSHTDPQGRPTVFQRLPKHLPRLISVGRLDFNTEGLILLTNDGALARVLELPATGWLRRYRVRAHGSVTQAQLDELRAGVTVDGVRYQAIEATLDRVQGSNLWLSFAIREGKNREVRNVLGHLGLMVTRLIRISFGPFQLGDLAEGAVEEVPTRVLRDQLGERLVALAGADFSAPMAKQADASIALYRHPEAAAKRPSKDERPQRQPKSPQPAHSWRRHEEDRPAKKLRRKFRGSRREDKKPADQSAEKPRTGLLTDRKGRHVLVERFGQSKPPEQPDRGAPKCGRPGRRRVAPDRSSGARPRHPRGR